MSLEGSPMTKPGQGHTERRLAAILAADVAGYSRLMGEDEAGTAQALREHLAAITPIVTSRGGRVVKTTGDGVLLDFSSIVAAVECAAAVQQLMAERNAELPQDQQMLFRIGVNLGDVLIEGEDILGDGVNIAARLEGIAEPGGICISDDAYRQVQGKVAAQFVDTGEQQLKNISRPVRAYRVLPQGTLGTARPALPLPEKPSVAVLPFDNMSEVSEDIYFADGIAEDIITELSRYPDLFVAARNSSFTYRGKVARVTDVARGLGVRYVLEGSVRRAGNRVRISAQLVDAASGKHLWAERYDRNLEDLFSIQDEVTQSIVAVLPARVQAARTPELFQQMIQWVERATDIDENDTECHRMMCRIALIQAQYARSEHHLECALALNPNDPRLVVQRGINLTFLGDPEAAIPWIERAMRLDPFSAHRYYLDMVRALFMAKRPAEAIVCLERTARSHWEHHLWLAACHAATEQQISAHQAGQQAVALRPNLSIAAYVDGRFKWKQAEDRARLSDALAQAGLPP
jgi:adenylate cyclase